MDTHGPKFSSDYHVFSDGSSDSEEEWNSDHYKDALLSYDAHVKEVYDYLDRSGKLNNTILLVYTDHGYRYVVNQRIPVIIHFPNASEAGLRHNNIQNIDIPVTILDYLDIPIPDWMTGISMLGDEPPADREIISITAGSPKKIGPPFYQIKIVQIIVCQKWYYLNVQENEWKSGLISRHTSNCDDDLLLPDEEIHQRILNYLEEYKYDVSSLQ
jgi:arylsulfatase A-like enzyme